MAPWSKIDVTKSHIWLIFKFRQYKNANIANFLCKTADNENTAHEQTRGIY